MTNRLVLFVTLFSWFVCLPSVSCGSDFIAIAGWDQQLFPSYIVGTATMKSNSDSNDPHRLGDPNGLIGVELVAPRSDSQVEVTIECEGFMETSRFAGRLPEGGETYSVFPKIKFRYDRLAECHQATPATITYRVKIDNETTQEQNVTVAFRPIHDCPLKIKVGESIVDTSFTFATYVNEQHPYVDKLLREALDIGLVEQFTGYQSNDQAEVMRQVYSIWDLCVARDVRYSSITTTAADSDSILSQHVRLIENTVNNQQANCVDGSVLMVSMLRKIGIDSFLVLVPGHCYLGFYVDEKRDRILCLENTLVGATVTLEEGEDDGVAEAIAEDYQYDRSWGSFVRALAVGTSSFIDNQKKFSSEDEPDYRLIDVASARQRGVLPVPFRGKEEFVAFDHAYSEEWEWTESTDMGEEESENESDESDGEYEEDEEWKSIGCRP